MIRGFFSVWYIVAAISIAPTLLLSFRALWVVTLCFWLPSLFESVRQPKALEPPRWSWPIFAFAGWVTLTTLWSPSDRIGSDLRDHLLVLILSVQMLSMPTAKSWVFALGTLLALAVLTIDAASGNMLRHAIPPDQEHGKDAVATARGMALVLIMLPPALLWMWRNRRGRRTGVRGPLLLAGIGTAAAGVVAYGVALLAGIVGWMVTALRPLWGRSLLALSALFALAQPFALAVLLPQVSTLSTWNALPDSTLHRLIIWRTLLDEWAAGRLLTGAGGRATYTLTDRLGDMTLPGGAEVAVVSAHAHNVPVQILYEFGLIGYGLLVWLTAILWQAFKAQHWARDMEAAIVALALGFGVVLVIDIDFWHLYFWCALSMSILALKAVAKDQPR